MPKPKALNDLLAPVPLVHLLSAIENGIPSEVAFGSEKDRLFGKLGADVTTGMRVWIYASKRGSENLDPARRQRVCFVGDFGGSTETGLSYASLHDARPPSAKTGDSSWILLCLVRNTAIQAWLHLDDARATRATALSGALKEHLRLIVLDLDDTDEPQAIFETLNANGAPLLPADLTKNWLLWEATRQQTHDLQQLYETYWQFFDREPDYWRGKSGTGHAARARVDTFLQTWLIRRTHEPIAPTHLYDRFLTYAAPRQLSPGAVAPAQDLRALMADIHTDGHRFREINDSVGKTRFDKFSAAWGSLISPRSILCCSN